MIPVDARPRLREHRPFRCAPPAYQASGALLLEARDWAFALGAGLAFNLSALLLNHVLYRSRLVPRWLSIWGLIAAALWTAAWFPPAFGVEPGVLEMVFLPIAAQEMVFGVYLIVRGFDLDAIATLSAMRGRAAAAREV